MNTFKSLLASRFEGAAAEFDRLRDQRMTQSVFIKWHTAMDEAGKLVVAAIRDGYLRDIEGLVELVAWVESDAPHPLFPKISGNRQATYVRCHFNLMNDLIGNNLVTVKNNDGHFEMIGDQQHGGLLQRSNPRAFPPRSFGDGDWQSWAIMRAAEICRAFADAIRAEKIQGEPEQSSPPTTISTKNGKLTWEHIRHAHQLLPKSKCKRSDRIYKSLLAWAKKNAGDGPEQAQQMPILKRPNENEWWFPAYIVGKIIAETPESPKD